MRSRTGLYLQSIWYKDAFNHSWGAQVIQQQQMLQLHDVRPSKALSCSAPSLLMPPCNHAGGLRREDVHEAAGSGQDVLMPPQRRNWKRCASHVYIAHFIEYQLHREMCASRRFACRADAMQIRCCICK